MTSSKDSKTLYEKREKIYPRETKGIFQNLRNYTVVLLLGAYYLLPWIQWNDRQAILFDLPARKFHIFFLTFWPQDFFFLTLLLILAGLTLFFVTAIAGRVWCGFACPQTVWTEIFIWMERWVEGTRAQQMRLSAMPWNATKVRKRFTKQFLWLSFALLTGLTFVGYFQPIRELVPEFFQLQLDGWSLFWVLFYGFATYGNAGFLREQVCKYMCPYARFQSAMFDKNTLIVAYDKDRGEPRSRGKRRKQVGSGDCVDCGICVQVCPTGIDIRDGLQFDCIACAACIDACNQVMDSVGYERQLIRYSTEAQDEGSERSLMQTILRPRILIYSFLLTCLLVGTVVALFMRANFQVDVLRDRNALYRWSDSAQIENVYQIRLMNKSQNKQRYAVEIEGLNEATVHWSGVNQNTQSAWVDVGGIGEFTVIVAAASSEIQNHSQSVTLIFSELEGESPQSVTEETRFWGPLPQPGAR